MKTFIGWTLIVLIIAGSIGSLGWAFGRNHANRQAAKAGVGAFVLNHQTGKVEFQYMDIQATIMSVVNQMNQQRPLEIK